MIISYEWIKSLLPGLTLSPAEVAKLLTLHSFEVVVLKQRVIDPRITVVRIEATTPHPNADRLQLATVTDGQQTITVVCGAPNISVGAVVPYSPPGTTVLDEKGDPFTLTVATVRGVESPGMLNSLRELGLSQQHAGIYILPPETPVGSKLRDYIPDDTLLEADITRNRAPDCLSARGIARELGALLGLPVNEAAFSGRALPSEAGSWQLTVAAVDEVPRYIGVYVEQTTVGPSPLWLQARLLAMGTRPINSVVDVTNYVMFELGQPVHAFDAEKLPGKTMGVRVAQDGEIIATLDGVTRTLDREDLVIVSDDVPVALAGVMGGSTAEVTATTSRAFIEVASFAPYTIQKTSQRHGVRTESAARFSKGIDAEVVQQAAERTVALLGEMASATPVACLEHYPVPRVLPTIALKPSRVAALAGAAVAPEKMQSILTSLRFSVDASQASWQVVPPSDRLDIEGEEDVLEEIIRVYGLENIAGVAVTLPAVSEKLPHAVAWREAIRDLLVKAGMTETYNYSFAPGALSLKLGEKEASALEITNPIAPEQRLLRQSLLPGILQNVQKNRGEFRTQRLFEIGTVFSRGRGGAVPGVREKGLLAGAVVGEENVDTFVAVTIERLLSSLGITDVTSDSAVGPLGELMVLRHRRHSLGRYGRLAPSVAKELKITTPIAVFEVELEALTALATNEPTAYHLPTEVRHYQSLSKYPPVWRDVSLLVAPEVSIEQIQNIIEEAGGALVVDVDLFDVYQPSPGALADEATQPEEENNAKSIAFHIKYQSHEKTLTDDEVAAIHNKIVQALQAELSAKMRE